MDPAGNFLYVPAKEPEDGQLYELSAGSHTYNPNSFVLIPYSEPRLQKPKPEYFGIVSTRKVEGFLDQETHPAVSLDCETPRETYIKQVERLKHEIQLGNIYEVNFCIRFSAKAAIDPGAVFLRLCRVSKAPYQMFARIGQEYILCASPELFLRKEGNTLYTKPIKGTMRRGATVDEDVLLRESLYESIKDRTENVMAVDVARNDLSMLATKGSVTVNKLYNIETFESVHQMVSTVKCELAPGISFEQIIDATFPMASMTGAPKRRAMQLIGETESFARHFYSGTMGIINHQGDFTLPVLIRSLFYGEKTNELWCAAGGAITSLSVPEDEYEECLLKAAGMMRALTHEAV